MILVVGFERTIGWFLRDPDGHFSWVRLAGMIALDAMVAALVADWIGHPIPDSLIQCFTGIVMVSIGGSAGQHWAPKEQSNAARNPPVS